MELKCDFEVYHPLGGAAYVFEHDLISFILRKIKKKKIVISVGAQPNSSPHFGTLCVFSLAFSLARMIKEKSKNKDAIVLFEVVDTAPSETIEINEIKYQNDLKHSDKMANAMKDFVEILNYFSKKNNIMYKIRNQSEFNSQKEIKNILSNIVSKQDDIKFLLDPDNGRLRVRCSCPKCGLVDKEGINTIVENDVIKSVCPNHGNYIVNFMKESSRVEYNTPLRNLVRAIMYGMVNNSNDYDYEIIRITGADYAGFYQEELLYKTASIIGYEAKMLPMIIYCPLILDWSGAKLSKSLYVKEGAYNDLPKYVINYSFLKEKFGVSGLDVIADETYLWLNEPYRLFRNYSVYYFINLFEKGGKIDGFEESTERDNTK